MVAEYHLVNKYVALFCRTDGVVDVGWAMMRGRRSYNEDTLNCRFATLDDCPECGEIGCIGVFDGHGGPKASEFVQENLFQNILQSSFFPNDVFKALGASIIVWLYMKLQSHMMILLYAEDGFVRTDSVYTTLDERQRNDDGCTATAALIIKDKLYVAHVGDSRAVLSEDKKAVVLTEDHKPNRVDERQRIEDVGGTVIHAGTWRVGGVLAVSRSFGNRLLKRFIVAHPEIRQDRLHVKSNCLIVASDGLWDVFTNQEAVDEALKHTDPQEAAHSLIQMAYDKGSFDNISCIVCFFKYLDECDVYELSGAQAMRASDTALHLKDEHHM